MRLAILTCMWQRHDTFRLCAAGLRRLKDKYGVIPLVVGSEGEISKRLCEGLYYVEHENLPLGAKYNAGMLALKELKPDYVMGLGSDDFLSDKTMQYILDRCKEGYDLIGFSDMYLYDINNRRLGYWGGYTARHRVGESMGMARTLSKRILDRLAWTPRQAKANKGLDWTMTVKIKRFPHTKHVASLRKEGLMAVDVKDGCNICSYDLYNPELIDNELLNEIPELCVLNKDM